MKKILLSLLISSSFANAHESPIADKGLPVPTIGSTHELITTIKDHMSFTQLPSGGKHVELIDRLIKENKSLFNESPDDWKNYVRARTYQFNHEYKKAINHLDKITSSSRYFLSGKLLQSRLHTLSGENKAALSSCSSLAILAPDVAIACLSDAENNSNKEYIEKIEGMSPDPWRAQLISEFYWQNNQADYAYSVLNPFVNNDNAPVSLLMTWADIGISLNKTEDIINKFTSYHDNDELIDDAMLLRVAEAHKVKNATSTQYRHFEKLISDRMHYRLHQKDKSVHAYELSRYYKNIKNDHKKAIYWAKINYKENKDWRDKKWLDELLEY